MINYNNKRFKAVRNSENGDSNEETIFHYQQEGKVVFAKYTGGKILYGQLIGLVDANGVIEMSYHHIKTSGMIMTGKCISQPNIDAEGTLYLIENWEWTNGNKSKGQSIIEEF